MNKECIITAKIVCDIIDSEQIVHEIKNWYYSNAIGMENIEVLVEK